MFIFPPKFIIPETFLACRRGQDRRIRRRRRRDAPRVFCQEFSPTKPCQRLGFRMWNLHLLPPLLLHHQHQRKTPALCHPEPGISSFDAPSIHPPIDRGNGLHRFLIPYLLVLLKLELLLLADGPSKASLGSLPESLSSAATMNPSDLNLVVPSRRCSFPVLARSVGK